MATNFPTSLDALVNPSAGDSLATVNHADQHANANDAIEALQAKVGVNGSAVTTSLDYLVRNIDATSAVVSGSSASALMRITQTGSGNALVVEDSTNPDGTPFVIDASGNALFGEDTATTIGLVTPKIQVAGTTASSSSISSLSYQASASGPRFDFAKSRSATVGSHTIVNTNDDLGGIRFYGSDGSAFVQSANIIVVAEGTPSSGVIPSSLRFSTANSSGTVAERMRIDPSGNLWIGTTAGGATSLSVSKNLTGATTAFGIISGGQVQSDVTGAVQVFRAGVSTAAASFTVSNLHNFYTDGIQSLGAGSSINNLYGFTAGSNLTSGTNNFGFYGSIASGVGCWNIYMNGTANNYLAGRLGVGATLTSGAMAQITNTTAADKGLVVKGAASQSGNLFEVQNSAGTALALLDSAGNFLVGMTTIATSSAKTIHIANGTAPSANPTAGGVLYVESGALKYRGSSGTVTTIATA